MSGGVGSAEQSTYNLYGYSENEIPGLWELLNKYYQLHLPEWGFAATLFEFKQSTYDKHEGLLPTTLIGRFC
mgnify:CR=1 FL=1